MLIYYLGDIYWLLVIFLLDSLKVPAFCFFKVNWHLTECKVDLFNLSGIMVQ